MISWFQGPRGQTANDLIVQKLTAAQVQANTTRGSTPGLIDPARGRAGGRVYLQDEGPGDDTESESSESDSDTESGVMREAPGGSAVEGSPLKAEPIDSETAVASGETASGNYESQEEESDNEEEDGEDDKGEREEYGEKHDREETIDLPTPKRRCMEHDGQES